MVIYQSECMGRILQYVVTSCGNYLYKQRRKSFADWQSQTIKLLVKAKYDNNEILNIIKCYSTNNWYVNEQYYKKPENVVQRVNEFGKEWVIDLELSI